MFLLGGLLTLGTTVGAMILLARTRQSRIRKIQEARLDQALADSMDCSDAITQYMGTAADDKRLSNQ